MSPSQDHRSTLSSRASKNDSEVEYKIALLGLGHRGYQTHFLNTLSSRSERIVAACEPNPATRMSFTAKHPDVPVYSSLQELLVENSPTFAIVCVPHEFHLSCVEQLSRAGIPVLKEKPVAESQSQFEHLTRLPIKIGVTFQKRFEPRYIQFKKLLLHVGDIASFRSVLAMNLRDLDATWRATSGVGVTEDLGCHLLNVIVWFFGRPSSLIAHQVSSVRPFQQYEGDDISHIIMHWDHSAIVGHIHLSRVAHAAEESITVTGTNGTLRLDGSKVTLLDTSGSQQLEMIDTTPKQSVICSMVRQFGDYATGRAAKYPGSLENLTDTVAVSEAINRSFQTHQTQVLPALFPSTSASLNGSHHVWPLVTPKSLKAINRQALSTLSIYDRSNIYQVFEDRWREMHGLKHALTCSSGTIAIYHMFEALDLQPGDEILCPVYTFFATATPLLQYGAVPVFCDALPDGNINPLEILEKATSRTKAVIVTHMWGLPCEMPKVMEYAQQANGGIKVLEDCSHAHGASIGGKLVGSWGHMAAWSLQAKKNITGGQAGVFATNDTDYYARAILHGHFNKRAKQEVPQDHPLRKFWLTGLGLNLRAHPLAIALANHELDLLPRRMHYRSKHANYLTQRLSSIPFLKMPLSLTNATPTIPNNDTDNRHPINHAWYAFVMTFTPSAAPPHLTRSKFVSRLHARGLSEVDIPASTGLLHQLPIFTHTHEAIPRYGSRPWRDTTAQHTQQRKEEEEEEEEEEEKEIPSKITKAKEGRDNSKEEEGLASTFPTARQFFDRAIKLPVWATAEDWPIVRHYGDTFVAVAEEVLGQELGKEVVDRQAEGSVDLLISPTIKRERQARLSTVGRAKL